MILGLVILTAYSLQLDSLEQLENNHWIFYKYMKSITINTVEQICTNLIFCTLNIELSLLVGRNFHQYHKSNFARSPAFSARWDLIKGYFLRKAPYLFLFLFGEQRMKDIYRF